MAFLFVSLNYTNGGYKNKPLINPPRKAVIRKAAWNVPEPNIVKFKVFDNISSKPAQIGPYR